MGNDHPVPFTLTLDLPRDGEHVGTLRDVMAVALSRHGAPSDIIGDLQVVIAEAAGNVIRHADGTTSYSVEVVLESSSCAVVVRDEGPGFTADDGEVAVEEMLEEGGRGLTLMNALTDDLQFIQDGDTRVRFVKRW